MEWVVEKNKVVTVEYHVFDSIGNLIDVGKRPLVYLHGSGELFPAIESQLEGKKVGETQVVHLTPHEAYGAYDINLLRTEPHHHFPPGLEVGVLLENTKPEAHDRVKNFRVLRIGKDAIILDGNHALAGCFFSFTATIGHIRNASDAELENGCAHSVD